MRNRGTRRLLTAGLAPLVVILAACSGPQDEPVSPTEQPSLTAEPEAYAAELTELTNDVRDEEGLPKLGHSECARDAALERAEALVGQDELTHAPLAPVIADCAPQTTAAENLVNSLASPIDVVEAWLGSPGHRANLIDADLTEIGIGCVPDGGMLLCSQVFLGP